MTPKKDKELTRPFLQGSEAEQLKRFKRLATLAGGQEGSEKGRSLPFAFSAGSASSEAASLGVALDALSAMFCGLVGRDRGLLDSGFEDLVGVLEEWRDAVPKTSE